jgi:hypothetical protein
MSDTQDAPFRRAAARRSPQAILDSRSGLEKRALQELDGEARSAGTGDAQIGNYARVTVIP